MSTGRICVRTVHVAAPEEMLREAARRMGEADVGSLIVVDEAQIPLGILTDRDIALRCVAENRDPDTTPIESVMTTPVERVLESTPIEDALGRMAGTAVRRLVVTDDDGRLVGVLALDDVVELLVEEAEAIGRLLHRHHPPGQP